MDWMTWNFIPGLDDKVSTFSNVERTPTNDGCDAETRCSETSLTLLTYTGESNSIVQEYFSGKLYDDKPGYGTLCKTSDEHTIEGESGWW